MRALVVMDYTVDFVVGKLPCGQPAIGIEDRITALAGQFANQGDFVVMAGDLHDEEDLYHPEHRLFPPHNIRGSDGRKLYGKLDALFYEKTAKMYWMDKTR